MSGESDLINLYSGRILELATNVPYVDRLENPDASAKKRSPLCGSAVTVDITLLDDKITGYAQDVKACALGQAAAAVIGQSIIGRTLNEVQIARDELNAMLKQDGPIPSAPFQDLEVLLPAKDFKNRHASILLSLDATLAAFAELDQKNAQSN
jgi:NifU-like protein involved in Fe-S cluster formation